MDWALAFSYLLVCITNKHLSARNELSKKLINSSYVSVLLSFLFLFSTNLLPKFLLYVYAYNSMKNYKNSPFVTFGTRAVDHRKLANDNFCKRMVSFD